MQSQSGSFHWCLRNAAQASTYVSIGSIYNFVGLSLKSIQLRIDCDFADRDLVWCIFINKIDDVFT